MSIRRAHSAFKEEVGLQLDNVGRQTTLARNWLGSGGRQARRRLNSLGSVCVLHQGDFHRFCNGNGTRKTPVFAQAAFACSVVEDGVLFRR